MNESCRKVDERPVQIELFSRHPIDYSRHMRYN